MMVGPLLSAGYIDHDGVTDVTIPDAVYCSWNPVRNFILSFNADIMWAAEATLVGALFVRDPETVTQLNAVNIYGGDWVDYDSLYPRLWWKWRDAEQRIWRSSAWPVMFNTLRWSGSGNPGFTYGGGRVLIDSHRKHDPPLQEVTWQIAMVHCELGEPIDGRFSGHLEHRRLPEGEE